MAGFDYDSLFNNFNYWMGKKCSKCKVGRYTETKPTVMPYCDVALSDNSGGNYDLQGNEGSQDPMIQITIYATGSLADVTCNKISKIAKEIMISYGFQCRGGPMPVTNATDPSIKRWVARYQRIFGAGDEIKQIH